MIFERFLVYSYTICSRMAVYICLYINIWACKYKYTYRPGPPNYPLRNPKYHLMEIRRPLIEVMETIRPLIEVHWGVLVYIYIYIIYLFI